jgi:hypothetical protein
MLDFGLPIAAPTVRWIRDCRLQASYRDRDQQPSSRPRTVDLAFDRQTHDVAINEIRKTDGVEVVVVK